MSDSKFAFESRGEPSSTVVMRHNYICNSNMEKWYGKIASHSHELQSNTEMISYEDTNLP